MAVGRRWCDAHGARGRLGCGGARRCLIHAAATLSLRTAARLRWSSWVNGVALIGRPGGGVNGYMLSCDRVAQSSTQASSQWLDGLTRSRHADPALHPA